MCKANYLFGVWVALIASLFDDIGRCSFVEVPLIMSLYNVCMETVSTASPLMKIYMSIPVMSARTCS